MRAEWVTPEQADAAEQRARRAGATVLAVDGRRCRTRRELLAEFARAGSFPAWFGHNWSALEDSLDDLDWLAPGDAGILLVVRAADDLLAGEPEEVGDLLTDLLQRVARHWAAPIERGEPFDRPARTFRLLFVH